MTTTKITTELNFSGKVDVNGIGVTVGQDTLATAIDNVVYKVHGHTAKVKITVEVEAESAK